MRGGRGERKAQNGLELTHPKKKNFPAKGRPHHDQIAGREWRHDPGAKRVISAILRSLKDIRSLDYPLLSAKEYTMELPLASASTIKRNLSILQGKGEEYLREKGRA